MRKYVHIHNKTTHKVGTPEYPSPDAVFIYHMACGQTRESSQKKRDFVPSDIKQDGTCPLCRIKMFPKSLMIKSRYPIIGTSAPICGGTVSQVNQEERVAIRLSS